METTSMKPFKISVTFGRFNLLHKGHVDLFVNMSKVSDEVWIGMSTGPKNLDFTFRRAIIEKALKQYGIKFRIFPCRQPFEVFNLADRESRCDAVCYFGEDQAKLSSAIEKAFSIECRLNPRMTSSTTVRSLIDNEEWDLLAEVVPGNIINDVTNLHINSKQDDA